MPSGWDEKGTRRAMPRIKFAGALLGAGLLSAGVIAGLPGNALVDRAAAQESTFSRAPRSFADLADKVRPAVVSVNVKTNGAGPEVASKDFPIPDQPERRPMRAQGSGFLISADGYVVTNHHVADKADQIEVTFEDEEKYPAKVIGSDARTDIALLKIQSDKKFEHWLEFADAPPRVGDWVLAVGNPFGLGGTVTAGIVSAAGRDIGSGPYDFLQIDAAVNKGNSGGPAVNLDGKVVGVNTAIYSPSGGSVGIAFAIPAATARDVVAKLKAYGKVSSGWLGVQIQNVDDAIAESLGVKSTKGALVSRILPDGPASKSDLKPQDLILKVEGKPINNSRELARTIAGLSPNTDAHLRILRNGEERDVTVKLGEFPAEEKFAALGGQNENQTGKELEDLGLTLVPASEFPGSTTKDGVAVSNVDPNSKAADQGLRKGDIITEVGGKQVSSPADVVKGIRDARAKGRKNVLVQVRSRDQQRFLALPVTPKDDDKKSRH
jgi:serine protease Do